MPAWKLKISQSVLKDLRDLPKDDRGRAALAVLELAATPYPHGAEKLKGYEYTTGYEPGITGSCMKWSGRRSPLSRFVIEKMCIVT